MKQKHVPLILALGGILLICFVMLSQETKVREQPIKNISIVTRGPLNESWENFKQGAEQAGMDMNAEIHFVSLSKNGKDKVQEQIELLKREEASSSDAIVIAPADYTMLGKPLDNIMKNIPIILVESKVDSLRPYEAITCDNTAMGESLANEVMRHGNMRKKILIIDGGVNCGSILEREKSFEETMSISHNELIKWEDENVTDKDILDYLLREKVDVIAAMDTEVLEAAAEALKQFEEYQRVNKIELYGVGSGSKVIGYLEKDYITSTVVQDDFSMGYLGVKDAVNAINGKEKSKNAKITFTIVDHEHMYSEENQRLLFPFVR